MRHLSLIIALMFAVTALAGGELSLNGDFAKLDKEQLPEGWVQHTSWEGFKPFAKIKVIPGEKDGKNALLIYENNSKHGACVRTVKKIPAKPGDELSISVRCKGKGKAWVGIYTYSEKGEWGGDAPQKYIDLTEDWKSYQFDITVPDGNNCLTGAVDIIFGANANAEAAFSEIKVRQEKSRYTGTLKFPLKWTVFLPMNKDFKPGDEQLKEIPEAFDGVQPRSLMLLDNQFDFLSHFGNKKAENCAWLFAEVDCKFDLEATIGAGADWWMQYFVNGEKVIDTIPAGNIKTPVRIDNHTANIKLKKGKNVLAVKFLTGSSSALLMLGGPNELRAMNDKITVSSITNSDDYDTEKTRPGNPQLIKDYPTPGLTMLTGQAIYTAAPEVKISFPDKSFDLPAASGNAYFATGIRVQSFGQQTRLDSDFFIDVAKNNGNEKLSLILENRKNSPLIIAKITETLNGKTSVLKQIEFPYAVFPADLTLSVNQKNYIVNIASLADSSFRSFNGDAEVLGAIGSNPVSSGIALRALDAKAPAQLVVDNYFTGEAGRLVKVKAPLKIELLDSFDPAKAGWTMIFNDEFDGDKINKDKWFFYKNPAYSEKNAALDGKGNLIITTDYNDDKTKLMTSGLWTTQSFLYGYFESRLKFTKQPGWWAAFWLYGPANGNPFLDGFEIDIFEDYYTRPRKKGDIVKEYLLDHNLHIYTGALLKSWNYNSKLSGSIDEFYVIGVKWTPFEISYYINGKLVKSSASHSPYDSVTFDAVNHGMGISPLHAIVSGQIGMTDQADGKFPEQFIVDYVRIYESPADKTPAVSFAKTPSNIIIPQGENFTFEVKAEPSEKTKAAIQRVYLFDNGYMIDYKEKAPYIFDLAIDKKHYANTAYMASGRAGVKPQLDSYTHAYAAVAQDELGNIGVTQVVPIIPAKAGNTPYKGQVQTIPGTIKTGFYDEGGPGIAYYDTTKENHASKTFRVSESVDSAENGIGNVVSGEWTKYTVDIAKDGIYDATLRYGSDSQTGGKEPFRLLIIVDGKLTGEFRMHFTGSWGCTETSYAKGLHLPAGKHVLTLLVIGAFNFGNIEFKEEAK